MRRSWRIGLGACGLGIALVATGCQTSTPVPSAPPRATTHESLNATLWLQTAAEYRAATMQAYRTATVHLERALTEPGWTAAPEQAAGYEALPPAVILDMDEAIIRSDRFQGGLVEGDETYRLDDWNDWVRTETSEAIAGALEYVRHAQGLGVHVFYVTNRTAEVEAESLATLRKVGFPVAGGLDDLLTQGEQPGWGSDKSSRRAVVCRTHRVLQIVGDNLNDFIGGAHTSVEARRALVERHASFWGTRWIVTPNPAYGGWEGALYDYDYGRSREDVLRRKREHLRSWR